MGEKNDHQITVKITLEPDGDQSALTTRSLTESTESEKLINFSDPTVLTLVIIASVLGVITIAVVIYLCIQVAC